MTTQYLTHAIEDIPSLQAVFVTAMPDCLLYDAWVRPDTEWRAEEVASYFGDLFRANREGLKALGAWSTDMQITLEAPDHLILLRELSSDFICACVFESGAALGMARLNLKRLVERVRATLPKFEVTERPRGVRIVEFLHRYAPDPHAVLLRISLRTRLPMAGLQRAEELEPEDVGRLENAACEILGLQALNL